MKLFQQRKAPKWILGLALLGVSCAMNAQEQEKVQGFVHEQSDESGYVWPTDSLVLKKLDVWKDQKFGVLFHWGLYSVPGIESHGLFARKMWIGFHGIRLGLMMNTRNGTGD